MLCQCVSVVCHNVVSVCVSSVSLLCQCMSGKVCVTKLCRYVDTVCQFAVSSQVMEAGKIINSLNIYNLYSECYQGPSGDNKTRISPPFLHLLMPHQLQVLPPSLTATQRPSYVCVIINISTSEILYNTMIFFIESLMRHDKKYCNLKTMHAF